MNSTRLSEAETVQQAANWAEELFSSGPAVAAVLVLYDPWSVKRKGRRNKPGAVRAELDAIEALRRGDIRAARAATEHVSQSSESGVVLCEDREALTAVLTERLRRGEVCYDNNPLHECAVKLTVWRE